MGKTLPVTVTATNSAGSATGTSCRDRGRRRGDVVGAAPSLVSPPVISGTAQQGQTLTSSTGTWNGTQPMSYSYQWYRCDSARQQLRRRADGAVVPLSSTDVGKTLPCDGDGVELGRLGERHLGRDRGRVFVVVADFGGAVLAERA